MTRGKPGSSTDRARYPQLKDDVGEDPARFLDHDLVSTEWSAIVESRINGIDRLPVLRAWLAIERRLDRGPRDYVIDLLDERERFLQEHGDRPRDLRDADELPDRYYPGGRTDPDDVELEKNLINGEPASEVDRSTHIRSGRSTLVPDGGRDDG